MGFVIGYVLGALSAIVGVIVGSAFEKMVHERDELR